MSFYMIQAGEDGPVKIGKAADPERRRAGLQTAHYIPLNLLRVFPGSHRTEGWLHHAFASYRLYGEWFRFCRDMLTIAPPNDIDPRRAGLPLEGLEKWLHEQDMTLAQFGKQAGGVEESTVARWRDGVLFPSPKNVELIESITGGIVTYRDFQKTRDRVKAQ